MPEYLKLASPPTLTFQNPMCNACLVEVDLGDDDWVCPRCGTAWEYNAREEEPGTLFEDWSGETLPGEAIDPEDAWKHRRPHA